MLNKKTQEHLSNIGIIASIISFYIAGAAIEINQIYLGLIFALSGILIILSALYYIDINQLNPENEEVT